MTRLSTNLRFTREWHCWWGTLEKFHTRALPMTTTTGSRVFQSIWFFSRFKKNLIFQLNSYVSLYFWSSSTDHVLGGKDYCPALQMVQEKARVLLSRNELLSLSYYQEEYALRHMTIEAFVTVLLELLNTPEKVIYSSFLSALRCWNLLLKITFY